MNRVHEASAYRGGLVCVPNTTAPTLTPKLLNGIWLNFILEMVERMQFLFLLLHNISALLVHEAKVEVYRLYRNSCMLHKI